MVFCTGRLSFFGGKGSVGKVSGGGYSVLFAEAGCFGKIPLFDSGFAGCKGIMGDLCSGDCLGGG